MNPMRFGDSLFETVRVEGRPRLLGRHLTRFASSCDALGFSQKTREAGLAALKSLDGMEDGLWRVTVVREADILGEWPSSVTVEHRPLPVPTRPRLTVLQNWHPQTPYAAHKTTSYIGSMQTKREARTLGFDDALRTSRDGWVGEASMANVFVVLGDEIVTPPLEGILPGTRRAAILDAATSVGVEVVERALHVDELEAADEIILTSAGVLAIAAQSLDARPLAQRWATTFQEWLCNA